MTWEIKVIYFLKSARQLDVISNLVEDFTEKHGVKPERVLLTKACKLAFTVEMMERTGMPADAVLIEPLLFDGIPIITAPMDSNSYLILENRKVSATMTL